MRYFLVQFSKQPSGKFDEQATLAPKLKKNDIVKHAVVLDLELRRVEKCVIDGTVIDDFDKIINYYHNIYPDIFADYISNIADNMYLVCKYTQEGDHSLPIKASAFAHGWILLNPLEKNSSREFGPKLNLWLLAQCSYAKFHNLIHLIEKKNIALYMQK